jgi:hypothetical protein
VAVVAQRWDVARPQDVAQGGWAEAIAIQVRLLAITPGIPIAGNVIRRPQLTRHGEQSVKPALPGRTIVRMLPCAC